VDSAINVVELFAGVGGFRLGLEGYNNPEHPEFAMPAAGGFHTVWANNWEPDGQAGKQFAWRCYEKRFGEGSCDNTDIAKVVEQLRNGNRTLPSFDMLVGGFPCQDYSVAKPLAYTAGIEGKKGVLWWSINSILEMYHPRMVLLENVDRLLKSPVGQRGRDFAIILSCLYRLGYSVEWRVIDAAAYGMPQRRKRVYIYAQLDAAPWDLHKRLLHDGIEAQAFAVQIDEHHQENKLDICDDPFHVSKNFGLHLKTSPFQNSGVMQSGTVLTTRTKPIYTGPRKTLGDVLSPEIEIPEEFYIQDKDLPAWQYLKGSKKEIRTAKNGYQYTYSEGALQFPDSLDKPSRTILTGESGRGASRTKHVVRNNSKLRRLVPDELDQLQMFPKGWTNTGMSNAQRSFCMGNALVTQIPHQIGECISKMVE
jgi:DNA (cytosine-5)-methyltransferase 1